MRRVVLLLRRLSEYNIPIFHLSLFEFMDATYFLAYSSCTLSAVLSAVGWVWG